MKSYTTRSAEETEALGREIGRRLLASGRRHLFLALFGEMGVGKTAFCRGIAAAVAPGAAVRSPTYTVVNEYRGGALPVFHFDMYR
ncbi:MAG: tRNA (adenosine(37)-N6)-threonylcarbamoyltransferase complex ATPase subunit type 1 TsaE, partial [Clostridia bacterium]|nr:tRNA (adenosine(37)-N6)-threonylcarbamoyltransferase complex ATPase subunit type 1 TsaE [Clostridia bacterium]